MRIKPNLALTLALAGLVLPSIAHAQAGQTAEGSPGLGGPVIPGVCLLSREAIYANAAIGKAATARLQQLAAEAQAEIEAERKPIDSEIQAFRTASESMKPQERQQRDQDLVAKLRPVQAKAELRAREIEATRVKAMQHIADEAQPVIKDVYQAKKCGLLFDRNAALGGNFTNDITADVVRTLDAKLSTISFDRERLPVAPQGAAPASRP
ncbi:MAG TPA: OmpH family outer membrane protein [Sphingomonadaceae bacterium]|nr:OmpH family outer membrane protein [Sphingomonadaceae bacterium]